MMKKKFDIIIKKINIKYLINKKTKKLRSITRNKLKLLI